VAHASSTARIRSARPAWGILAGPVPAGDPAARRRFAGDIVTASKSTELSQDQQVARLASGNDRTLLVVCPWHGYEYVPATGASPPPFTEKVPTFDVRVVAGRVLVHPQPHAPGTRVEPAALATARTA